MSRQRLTYRRGEILKLAKPPKLSLADIKYVNQQLAYLGKSIDHNEWQLRFAMGEKNTILVNLNARAPNESAVFQLRHVEHLALITVDSKLTDCEMYTDIRKGGLYFLRRQQEIFKPWEFSLEKYVAGNRQAAAVEYTRRKLINFVTAFK